MKFSILCSDKAVLTVWLGLPSSLLIIHCGKIVPAPLKKYLHNCPADVANGWKITGKRPVVFSLRLGLGTKVLVRFKDIKHMIRRGKDQMSG